MSAASDPRGVDPSGGTAGWAQGLRTRLIFGVLMGFVALVILRQGDAAFGVLVAAGATAMAWEWTRLCASGQRFGRVGLITIGGFLAAIWFAFVGQAGSALLVCLVSAALAAMLARSRDGIGPGWAALGILYLGPALVALIWLRGHDDDGERMILWLILTVVVTDTGAFFAGRLIGGPRLAPRISPKKTWAGLGGAVVGSAMLGVVYASFDARAPDAGVLALAGTGLACVAQIGDLAESWVKRHFGAKDSSHLIPGHGGILDRVDGLVAAAIVFALAQWILDGRWLTWGA